MQRLSKFLFPIILIGFIFEYGLRHIPNDYQKKSDFLRQHGHEIEILNLGNSHAFYGVNPTYLAANAFNAAHVSQTFNYDLFIWNKYKDSMPRLKTLIIPISYSSYFTRLDNSVERWRIKNYCIYYGLYHSVSVLNYSEVLSSRLYANLKRLYSYYWLNKDDVNCSNRGFGNVQIESAGDLVGTGAEAAKRHTVRDFELFPENKRILQQLIEDAIKRKINIILVTLPASKHYTIHLDNKQLDKMVTTSTELSKKSNFVRYVNMISDSTFNDGDFFDGDHLNEKGAEKLTLRLKSIII